MWRQGPGSLVFFLAQQSGPAVWSDQILRRSEREAEVASFKQSYRNVWSAAELQAKNDQWQLVCANVFGLWWSH